MRLPILLFAISLTLSAGAQKLQRWTGTATAKGQQIPVELQLSKADANGRITGGFVNGPTLESASSGTATNGHVTLAFDEYARTFEGDVSSSGLHGVLRGARLKAPIPLDLTLERDGGKPATHFLAASPSQKGSIDGLWEIAVASSKGESAWTMQVEPFAGNGEIRAVIQRIDGDTGAMYGRFNPATGTYTVSRFGAFGGDLYSLKPQPDGTLDFSNLLAGQENHSVARRTEAARAAKLPPPTLPTEQTTVVDPSKPFQFASPNLAGATVSNTDPQFKGKVVIVAIGGSWCPNCHDEAPFLVELYNRFHGQGLEIVNLSFEEADQLKDPVRLREFIRRYRIPYTVLLAGTPDDLARVVPQGKNLNSWPTSFFIGRDGLVKETHAGFSGPATGEANVQLKAEVTALVERLLAQPAGA